MFRHYAVFLLIHSVLIILLCQDVLSSIRSITLGRVRRWSPFPALLLLMSAVMTTIPQLLRRGLPRSALRASIVRLPGAGGHHLILCVRRRGDQRLDEIFLDDRHHHPMRPEQLAAEGYVFVAQEVPGRWHWQPAARQPALMVAERGE